MKKAVKLALDKNQISFKETLSNIDGYEIFLFGDERDDFTLVDTISKPIFSVHYPISRCDCLTIANEYGTNYFNEVIKLCQEKNASLVLHTESTAQEIMNSYKFDCLLDYFKDIGLRVYVENCYCNSGSIDTLQVIRYMRKRIDDQHVLPLLDTCHLMMSEMSFKYEELSFSKAIDAFKSYRTIIHLNDCIGSGEKETGGIHGTNFSNNLYLLRNILWKLRQLEQIEYNEIIVVLEVDEKDYVQIPDTIVLSENIDKILNDFDLNY